MTSRHRRLAVLLSVTALIATACGSSASSPSASATIAPSSAPVTTLVPAETPIDVTATTELTGSPAEGQTDTEWGRIWDRLPSDFPVYPEAVVSEEAASGPASAVYALPQADPAEVAAWFQDHLEQAAYSTQALSGPLEDGSYVIDSIGRDETCRTEVTIAPLGGTILITVRYAAECPID